MITNTTPHDDGLRYWYVAVPSAVEGDRRREANAKLKAHNFKISRFGIKARIGAVGLAQRIERITGIEMEIGKHDYL